MFFIQMNTHNMFLWRTDESYPSIVLKYPSYLFYWADSQGEQYRPGLDWVLKVLLEPSAFLDTFLCGLNLTVQIFRWFQ